jgi:hypothetical protein
VASVVISGGQDGVVRMWSPKLEPLWTVDVPRILKRIGGLKSAHASSTAITSVDIDRYVYTSVRKYPSTIFFALLPLIVLHKYTISLCSV